jgi:hypothetical protein
VGRIGAGGYFSRCGIGDAAAVDAFVAEAERAVGHITAVVTTPASLATTRNARS